MKRTRSRPPRRRLLSDNILVSTHAAPVGVRNQPMTNCRHLRRWSDLPPFFGPPIMRIRSLRPRPTTPSNCSLGSTPSPGGHPLVIGPRRRPGRPRKRPAKLHGDKAYDSSAMRRALRFLPPAVPGRWAHDERRLASPRGGLGGSRQPGSASRAVDPGRRRAGAAGRQGTAAA